MAKAKQGSESKAKTQLEWEYEYLMQFALPSVPAPVHRDNLEQPEPNQHVETVTTYGIYDLA